jgi:glycerol-3-phosphate dehydrogenase subunit B
MYSTRWVILATGGIAAGGLELDSDWKMRETVFGLHVSHLPGPDQARFSDRYLDHHPLARAGIAADHELRPLVAGATLAGAEPWREKSGDGIALSTGHRAARLILATEEHSPRSSEHAVSGGIA